jgi:hypothetical protein
LPELRSKQPDIVRLPVPANARVAVALDAEAEAIIFDLVKPVWSFRVPKIGFRRLVLNDIPCSLPKRQEARSIL